MMDHSGFSKSLLKTLLVKSKVYLLTRPLSNFAGQIIMFHRVCPRGFEARIPDNELLEVSPHYLERVILFYKNLNYEFLSLDQMLERFERQDFRKKFVVFTFDDGYKDNYTLAYPIFKKHAVPFTLYLSTDFPDHKAILWWYLLEDLLLDNDSISFCIRGTEFQFSCRTFAEKVNVFKQLRWMIVSGKNFSCNEMIQAIFGFSSEHLLHKTVDLAMTWDQVKALSEDPLVTIAAHTVHHYSLSKLPSADALFEMTESKKRIESHIQMPVRHFSYPFGGKKEISDREKVLAEQAGFVTATTTVTGNVRPNDQDNLTCLPRINVNQSDDMKLLTLAVNGFLPQSLAK